MSYEKQNFEDGQVLTAAHLNHIEDGIKTLESSGGTGSGTAGEDGVGIASVQQTTTSTADGGTNIVTVTLTDGTTSTFQVKNGSKGSTGATGAAGSDGKDGAAGADGNGIASAVLNADYTLTLTFDDGTSYTTPSIRGATGPAGADGVGVARTYIVRQAATSGYLNEYCMEFTDGTSTVIQVRNGDMGNPGTDGQRGTGILYITTAPSSYTTAVGEFTPVYRIALSTVLTQSSATEVLVGDVLSYSYYLYPVGYVDTSYVYLGTRKNIRGSTGAAGSAGADGVSVSSVTQTTTSSSDGGSNVITVTLSDGTTSTFTVKNGSKGSTGSTGAAGYTPVKGVDYFTETEKNEMIELVASGLDATPEYVRTEAERVADNVLSVRGGKTFSFAAFSDAHIGYSTQSETSVAHAGMGLKYIREITNLDMVAHLGDTINGGGSETKAESKAEYALYHKAMYEGCLGIPTVWLKGNHDANYQNATTTERFTFDELYGLIGANNQGDHVVEYGNENRLYGYVDFESKRLRVIYLNTSDADWKTGVSADQVAWFTSTALNFSGKDAADEWGFVILTHIPLTFGDCSGLLSALNSYDGTDNAEPIAIFHGHCHNFRTEQISSKSIWQIGIPELCVGRNNEYGAAGQSDTYGAIFGEFDSAGNAVYYPKTADTAADTSFNIVTIDRASKNIYCHVFGAGYDRVLSYDGTGVTTYTITNKLTNVTSSNTATTASSGTAYSATLTVADGYTLGSVVVTMSGVDVTSTAYSEGVVSIASVTGNVVITAVANAVEVGPSYTNLFVAADVQTNVRFNSSGEIVSGNFWCVSTYIPAVAGDVIRVYNPNTAFTGFAQRVIASYDSSKAHIDYDKYLAAGTVSSDGYTYTVTVTGSNLAYIRVGGNGTKTSGVVITKNE